MKLSTFFVISICVLLEVGTNDAVENDRKGKWFFYPRTITKYVREKSSVTETVPSSCVVVPESLTQCRHAKELRIEPEITQQILKTTEPELPAQLAFEHSRTEPLPRFLFDSEDASLHEKRLEKGAKPLSWAEYFGLEDVTVTKTLAHSVTAKYLDPNTVFSFNVKGCRPTTLPFNLPLCENNNATSQPVNSFSKEVHYSP